MKFFSFYFSLLIGLSLLSLPSRAEKLTFKDPTAKAYQFQERASVIDTRVKAYPKINFLIEDKKGKPADLQFAAVDTRIAPKGELVIWLMGNRSDLFTRLNSYGLHAIAPHYARGWFSVLCKEKPIGPQARGNIRLEAATGKDFSDELDLALPDGMAERSRQFLIWLSKRHPQGEWDHFLTSDQQIIWDRVILAGASHGATTAARFAKHQKVARVVCHCGPRDHFQEWQALPSATPANRYFGFSHVLDGGWSGDHYCRSWEMLGLNQFGPIINVDSAKPPYGNTRRLISSADVGKDAKKAHSVVTPSKGSVKSEDGTYLYEPVWKYLYTHPVDKTGTPTASDPNCTRHHSQ